MVKPFEDRVAWITGASSGIGEALARQLAEGGARLVLSARRAEKLEALAAGLGPSRARVVPLDVADTAAAGKNTEAALAAFGRVDLMVHGAGISQRARIVQTALEVDRRIMEVNYFGVVALTKAILPAMVQARGGRFVVLSSVTGYVGTPYRSGYAASKHALHGFFESLRAEHAADGIEVTMVCPGFVNTDIITHALHGDGREHGVKEATHSGAMSAEACAARIVRAVRAGRPELYVGRESVGIWLRRYAPAVLRTALRHVKTT